MSSNKRRINTSETRTLISYKKALFFPPRTPTHHSFTFNSQFLYELKHMVHLSKTVCGIFHFRFRLAFIKLKQFFFNKMYGLMPNLIYTALQIAFSENIIG